MPGRKTSASSKNFLILWEENFGPDKVMEIPEYLVYCGIFITHRWGEKFVQIANGEFLKLPH
jgi:hypothetical protein